MLSPTWTHNYLSLQRVTQKEAAEKLKKPHGQVVQCVTLWRLQRGLTKHINGLA